MEYYMKWNGQRQKYYATLQDAIDAIQRNINRGMGGLWEVYYRGNTEPSYSVKS